MNRLKPIVLLPILLLAACHEQNGPCPTISGFNPAEAPATKSYYTSNFEFVVEESRVTVTGRDFELLYNDVWDEGSSVVPEVNLEIDLAESFTVFTNDMNTMIEDEINPMITNKINPYLKMLGEAPMELIEPIPLDEEMLASFSAFPMSLPMELVVYQSPESLQVTLPDFSWDDFVSAVEMYGVAFPDFCETTSSMIPEGIDLEKVPPEILTMFEMDLIFPFVSNIQVVNPSGCSVSSTELFTMTVTIDCPPLVEG